MNQIVPQRLILPFFGDDLFYFIEAVFPKYSSCFRSFYANVNVEDACLRHMKKTFEVF